MVTKAEVVSGTEFAFVDATRSLGHMIEVYEKSDRLLWFYDAIKQASHGWDGERPVRPVSELMK